jgi:hypothetical protein
MDVIDELVEKRKDVLKQLEALDTVLKIYGFNGSDYHFNNKDLDTTNSKVFPTKATRAKQVLWIFENKISKACKLKDIQKTYEELAGSDKVNIQNTARKLKKESKLLFVRYNEKNVLSFWGHPSWIDGNDFKNEYKPDMESLPDIKISEVMIGS